MQLNSGLQTLLLKSKGIQSGDFRVSPNLVESMGEDAVTSTSPTSPFTNPKSQTALDSFPQVEQNRDSELVNEN